jgi:ABC-2 type transport system permease protein
VHLGVSVAMTLLFLALCLGSIAWIFRTGYRIKN